MILAAGRGERMRPLTDHIPKPLLQVGGKPLIVWHLERLAAAGFREVVINHAHLGGQIESALGNGNQWGLSIVYSPEQVALETAGGIANALALLGTSPFLVINADIYTDINLAKLRDAQLENRILDKQKVAHLVMIDNPPQHPAGDFALENGLVKLTGAPMLTFSGVAVYAPQLFEEVDTGSSAKLAPLLKIKIEKGEVRGEHHRGVWHDIGTPQRLEELNKRLQRTEN